MKLFTTENTKGVFKGFTEGGMEFHADIILKYNHDFHKTPLHGHFLLVQLESEEEAALGRITSISAQGKLSGSIGEDYGIRAIEDGRPIPEDLLDQYLKYKVNIRVLGVIRIKNNQLVFAPSHRRLPHLGSKVAFPADELLVELAGGNLKNAADFGYFSLGEFIWAGESDYITKEPWMEVQQPEIISKFPISQLVSRRTFVFARAGFGKSNLVKLLFASLYKDDPYVEKRNSRKVPVGTLIFDPDGEYFWPDDKSRPGLCDVPHLKDKIVVFTNREAPSGYYSSFIAGGIKLDIRRLKPAEVISISLSPDRQEQQNVRKLKGLRKKDWDDLVDIIYKDGNSADPQRLKEILKLEGGQDAELYAARANMTHIVNLLHDPGSRLMDLMKKSLSDGKIVVVDISQMRGSAGLNLSGIILQELFNHNQEQFTKAEPKSIPTIAVLEEAQSVLGPDGGSDGPYVSWVKEGRKYDLGAVLITQQPGSISPDILSQGDNWFVFHLLSAIDLLSLKKANAHFSEDLLSSLLNEPIPGNGVVWSSSGGKTYPVSLRVFSFENIYRTLDPDYNKEKVVNYVSKLKANVEEISSEFLGEIAGTGMGNTEDKVSTANDSYKEDNIRIANLLKKDDEVMGKLKNNGIPWMGILEFIKKNLDENIFNPSDEAHSRVPIIMELAFGENGWDTDKRESKSKPGDFTSWIILKNNL